jgi:hypothetical protein
VSKPWLGLERELQELEARDPAVQEARRRLNQLPDEMARHERHLAARKAVGKRKLPEEER